MGAIRVDSFQAYEIRRGPDPTLTNCFCSSAQVFVPIAVGLLNTPCKPWSILLAGRDTRCAMRCQVGQRRRCSWPTNQKYPGRYKVTEHFYQNPVARSLPNVPLRPAPCGHKGRPGASEDVLREQAALGLMRTQKSNLPPLRAELQPTELVLVPKRSAPCVIFMSRSFSFRRSIPYDYLFPQVSLLDTEHPLSWVAIASSSECET